MKKQAKYILLAVAFAALLLAAVKGYDYLSKSYAEQTTVTQPTTTEPATQQTTAVQEESTTAVIYAPDFVAYDAEGNEISLSSFRGKPVILNFWATWCDPCNYEMPDFQRAYDKYGDKVSFVMLNLTDGIDDTQERVEAFIRKKGYTFPVYYDLALDGARTYGAYSIPRTYIIDGEGRLVYSVAGPVSETVLTQQIEKLIK